VQTLDQPIINGKPLAVKRWLIPFGGILAAIFGSMAWFYSWKIATHCCRVLSDLQQVELPVLASISVSNTQTWNGI